ncbi:trigger factor [Dyadobacter jejuensis]|uniref:Trigger factor n=1 Tax=Dyadobacter jejuensis TaxID=1082580 RepID=A0A316ARX2_9BACT|nr:trigger factor [Dyadobacter jejuensis]PWJ60352.1 trigger factor [Dyadobacter jejuensis]
MEVQLEKNSPTLASLNITLVKEDYQPTVDKTIKDYAKRVTLKGFRPGKVPTHVVQRMYGKSILVDEVNSLLSKTVSGYIRENKLQVVGDPIPNTEKAESVDWDKPETLTFSYELGLASDFEVNIAELPAVKRYTINVDDKELAKTVDGLKERFAETTHPEVSAEGDTVFGKLTQDSSEFSTQSAIPTKQLKEEVLAKFVGLKKDDEVVFDIQNTFKEESAIAHVTGKKKEDIGTLSGDFTLKVEDITRMAPSEVNEAFFEKVLGPGQVENEEQFNEKVLEIIKGNYERETEALLKRDIELALLEQISIDVPEEFLKNWLERSNEGKFTRQQIDEQFEDFKKSLKLSLIKNKVAEAGDIKVEYPEILAYTKQMVQGQFGVYGDDEGMNETIERVAQGYLADKERDNYSNVYNQVFDEKVFGAIRSQISTDEQTIEVSEFETLAKGEQEEAEA